MLRALYNLLLHLVLPFLPLRLWWRGRREPGYRADWAQRFGLRYAPRPEGPLIWVHAVSLGETAHELAHLRHMNHSPAFWREVARLYPDYQRAREALRTRGHLIPEL